jgi:hypothetical protein
MEAAPRASADKKTPQIFYPTTGMYLIPLRNHMNFTICILGRLVLALGVAVAT